MAWMPGAVRKEVRRHRTSIVGPRRLVLHTAVSAGSSLFGYFNVAGRPTSHFYVRADGTIEQYVDTRFRAPAQLGGNHDSISVETQDMGGPFPKWSGSNVPAWTGAQVDALARIAAWVHRTHGVPLSPLPNSRPGTRGVGYHRQGIAPWRVSGGETWSNARGKVCPGDRRVAQIPTIIARAKALASGSTPKPPEQEDDMVAPRDWTAADKKAVREALFGENRTLNNVIVKGTRYNVGYHLRNALLHVAGLRAVVSELLEHDTTNPLTREDLDAAIERGMRKVTLDVDVTVRPADDEDDPDAGDGA